MALEQKRKWVCDLCGVECTVTSGEPLNWQCNVTVICLLRHASADFCVDCYSRAFPTRVTEGNALDVPKDEFKKSWWQKFFGLEGI